MGLQCAYSLLVKENQEDFPETVQRTLFCRIYCTTQKNLLLGSGWTNVAQKMFKSTQKLALYSDLHSETHFLTLSQITDTQILFLFRNYFFLAIVAKRKLVSPRTLSAIYSTPHVSECPQQIESTQLSSSNTKYK